MDNDLYYNDPRSYALELVDSCIVDKDCMIMALLKYMSHDDVREALDVNELSPRFFEDYE